MKKIILSLSILFIVSCTKDSFTDTELEKVIDTVPIADNPFSVTYTPDYTKPSYYTRLPFPENVKNGTYREFSNWHPPLEAVVLDYDKDGYLDIIDNQSDYGVFRRNSILFLKGNSSGKLDIDRENSYKHTGLIHGRKGLVGDYNGDGWPDVFFIGHGYDVVDGNPRDEYPIMLLNNQGKDFEYRAFESVVGFFHTGASGDIDNDGDLDILVIDGTKGVSNSYIFINDGSGNFEKKTLDQYSSIPNNLYDSFFQKWTVELKDIDNNGYLDIIIAGAPDMYDSTPPTIMLNSANGFTSKIELPREPVYKLVVDIDFYDFDGDGIDELILNRTPLNYISYKVTIHSLTSDEYLTTTYFNNSEYTGQTSDKWMYWISIIEKDGELYLKGDDMYTPHEWIFEDGKFKKIK